MLRKCTKCGKILPETEFRKNKNTCKWCSRDYDWKYRYKIDPDEYFDIYTKQDGRCAICGTRLPDTKYLCVDHNHETGEVRGLLCDACNQALGQVQEDINILNNMVDYIKKWRK